MLENWGDVSMDWEVNKVVDGNYDKDEAKDELIELLERTVRAQQLKNFIEQPPK